MQAYSVLYNFSSTVLGNVCYFFCGTYSRAFCTLVPALVIIIIIIIIIVRVPMVTITSYPVSPVQPVGTNVTLTCNVELDRLVDVPLTVNTVWTGPDNLNRNIITQRMGNTTTYTSTVMVSSFGRYQSGDYTCTATVSSASSESFIISPAPESATSRITVGEL